MGKLGSLAGDTVNAVRLHSKTMEEGMWLEGRRIRGKELENPD